jgi:hypothetical protein
VEFIARRTRLQLGRAAFAGSQFADAVLPFSRYLKSHPGDIGARSVLAISQFMTGKRWRSYTQRYSIYTALSEKHWNSKDRSNTLSKNSALPSD